MNNSTLYPLVSIIIPLYNSENYVHKTIESILNQTYKNFELIIVDDASTDNSIKIINSYVRDDKRIKLIQSSSNFGGPARPRNIGIRESKGEYIAFCDNDDLWENNKLEMQLNQIIKNNFNFCCSDILLIDENNNELNFSFFRKITRMIFFTPTYFKLFFSSQIALSSVLISREFLGENKFDEDKNLIACEDYLLWLTLFRKKQIKYYKTKDKLVRYRIIKNSASSNKIRQQIIWMYCLTKHIINEKDFSFYPRLVIAYIFFAIKFPWVSIFNYPLMRRNQKKNIL